MPKGAALILEGGFDPNGQFYFLPIHDTARLAQLLRQRTVGLFLKLGLITEQFSETLLCWRHSGFSVDNSVRLDGGDHTARQALAQYIARAPLSLQKLTYDRARGNVLYHTSYNPYFRQNTNLWSATDFIAHLTQFIPPWVTTGCIPHGARRGGRACLTSRVSPPRGGGSPTRSRCLLRPKPRSPRRCRTPPVAQHGPD
jgi:hypothetical protein